MTLTDYINRRSSSPAPAPVDVPAGHPDHGYMTAWGLTVAEWSALTEQDRKDYRDRVVYAPQFRTV